MRARAFALICLALTLFGSSDALADKRVALVIGNSAYQHVPKLSNPANDATAVGLLFKSAGFDSVELLENLGVNDMRRAVRDFSDRARDADIAVIYYAGHGMEAGGVNYLIPVDASLRRDIDVEDEAVSLDRLLQVLEAAKRLRLVILDACRDNPFTKSMARTMASRAIGRGLARVEPATSDTLIAFAAKAGLTAGDGEGVHSPFTAALLKYLVTPGLDVRLALGRVRDDVLANTGNKQEPFVYGSLGGTTVTLASLSIDPRNDDGAATPTILDKELQAFRDYEIAAKVGTKEAWDSFLTKYPAGFYADLARSQRARFSTAPSKKSASGNPSDTSAQPQESGTKPPPSGAARPSERKKTKSAQSGGCVERCIAFNGNNMPASYRRQNAKALAESCYIAVAQGHSYCGR
jgi:Caspase domain